MNIHGVVTESPDAIVSANFMKGLVTVALMPLSFAPLSTFTEAFEMCTMYGNSVSKDDVKKTHNWIQSRKPDPRWSDGSVMSQSDVKIQKALPYLST